MPNASVQQQQAFNPKQHPPRVSTSLCLPSCSLVVAVGVVYPLPVVSLPLSRAQLPKAAD